jgi:hypothetical protein
VKTNACEPPPCYGGPTNEKEDCNVFETNICNIDVSRLALPEAAQGRCTHPSLKYVVHPVEYTYTAPLSSYPQEDE